MIENLFICKTFDVFMREGTQTYIKNYNFLFPGCYAVPLLYIYIMREVTEISVFATGISVTGMKIFPHEH